MTTDINPENSTQTELRLFELKKHFPAVSSDYNKSIPPNVYQTWEDNLFGERHFNELINFRKTNPDLSFFLFDADDRENYMKKFWGKHRIYQIFKAAKFGPMKADIFRYCLLFERGGFYFDISKGVSAPISRFINDSNDGLISYESNECYLPPEDFEIQGLLHPTKYILQWGFGFSKGHSILSNMISSICMNHFYFKERVFENPKMAILAYTGPGRFTKIVRNQLGTNLNINVVQAGIDFYGHGIFHMPGSEVRHLTKPAYTIYSNEKLFE